MTRSHMLSAVLQSFVLEVIEALVSHYTWHNTYTKIAGFEAFAPPDIYTFQPNANGTVFVTNSSLGQIFNITHVNVSTAFFNDTSSNSTTTTTTTPVNGTLFTWAHVFDSPDAESFLWKRLPLDLAPLLLVIPLNYFWHLWLERTFPGRSRGEEPLGSGTAGASHESEEKVRAAAAVDGMEDEVVEEAIVKKWIAQGKVKRASLSWFNTFAKLAVDCTFGNAWRMWLLHLHIDLVLNGKAWKSVLSSMFWLTHLADTVFHIFTFQSLATLLAFILVPAYKRIVFISGAQLAWTVFFQAFLNLLLPWAAKREFIQQIVRDANESNRRAHEQMWNATLATPPKTVVEHEL